ncbi:hypothetical protein ABZP36_034235 [Zizania latifolia]
MASSKTRGGSRPSPIPSSLALLSDPDVQLPCTESDSESEPVGSKPSEDRPTPMGVMESESRQMHGGAVKKCQLVVKVIVEYSAEVFWAYAQWHSQPQDQASHTHSVPACAPLTSDLTTVTARCM